MTEKKITAAGYEKEIPRPGSHDQPVQEPEFEVEEEREPITAKQAILALVEHLTDEERQEMLESYGLRVPRGISGEIKYGYVCSGCGELALLFLGSERPVPDYPAKMAWTQMDYPTSSRDHPACCKCHQPVPLNNLALFDRRIVHIQEWEAKKQADRELVEGQRLQRAELDMSAVQSAMAGVKDPPAAGRVRMSDVHASIENPSDQMLEQNQDLERTFNRNEIETILENADHEFGFYDSFKRQGRA